MRRISPIKFAVAFACILVSSIASACDNRASTHDWPALGREIVGLVRDNFHDSSLADAWARRHAGYGAAATSDHNFALTTRKALAELKASHTGYYTSRDPEYYSLLAIYGASLHAGDGEYDSIGVDVDVDHFVRVVFAGSPAARAGLKRGDKILKADGRDFDPIESFRGRSGVPVDLTVQHNTGQNPVHIRLSARRIKPAAEWLEAREKGARLIRANGKTVAYVPMFSCTGEEYENALKDLLSTRLRTADALILDFRNGWGGCSPGFVNLFNAAPPVLTYTRRGGAEEAFDAQWRKPLYLLINGGSRSGKEAVAYSIKKRQLGTLVGQPTAGAVLAGRCFLLSDHSLLLLAVADVRVDGERLEGRGVEPNVPVPDNLPYANGADLQLETAVELAAKGP